MKDKEGRELPPSLVNIFSNHKELTLMMEYISRIRDRVKQEIKDKNPIYSRIRWQQFNADCDNVYRGLKFCIPYSVCLICGGDGGLNGSCNGCKGTGFMNRPEFLALPDEVRNIK